MNRTASSRKPYLNREVVADRDRFYMAMLWRVGIEKGKPFKPNARQRMILEEAALVCEAMAKASDLAKRGTPLNGRECLGS